ncbi:phosphoadenosine phosphosulfate reductase [uncultured Roseobacter sp.]|uniref:phosphoadenosine phosphosulfate reductase n=1 Tax=uncultured Roseobacter sp. TaxID=114847 RepID=UPI00261AD161|nr:phosphoadenosine phosphosulfate reductase [uncultured Roseobacter sp.]
MPQRAVDYEQSLGELPWQGWLSGVSALVSARGSLTRLGPRHGAVYVKSGPTLLVSFENHRAIQALSPHGYPLGWDVAHRFDWSHLGLISDGNTWFRDPSVFAHMDALVDEGVFDGFDRVLFYGAGPCGYAAAAFSVAAPGATVLALQPQATLDPGLAAWDRRFVGMRRTSFTDRYGYAPDMLDAARGAFILFDPDQREDAMHAALCARPHVTLLRARGMGDTLQSDLSHMGCLAELLSAAAGDGLTPQRVGQLLRARRDHMPYLRRLLTRLNPGTHPRRVELLCRAVLRRHTAPRFAHRLEQVRGAPAV